MKRYSVAEARQQFARLLDAAERGEPVVIERRGIPFVVETRRPRRAGSRPKKSLIQRMDPDVAAGDWTWTSTAKGLRFKSRRRTR